jgi:hypothetical protein
MPNNFLSNDGIHAIINQMEVPMGMTAAELADLIVEKKLRVEQRAYDGLKQKVVDATSRMIADLEQESEFDLTDEDLMALSKVTEGLRELGYKFRFIEVQNPAGETIKHKLLVSIAHLVK